MAHEGLWEQLVERDGSKTAQNASCSYFTDPEGYVVNFLSSDYEVNLRDREIHPVGAESSSAPAGFLQQLCILAYLLNAKDIPLASKLVRGESFPGGQFFFRGIHCLPTEKLEKAFGHCPEHLHEVSQQFDAQSQQYGDASVELRIFPRVPITIVIWAADEEFGARASILFDETASQQIPLDALWTAVSLAVDVLIRARVEGD
jgi:hypothetical protein